MAKHDLSCFIDIGSAPRIAHAPGVETTILTGRNGEGMMMVLTEVSPGANVPAHSHPHEQMGMVYAGKAKMRIGEESRIIEKGNFCIMPPNVEHEAACMGDEPFVMLDIFYPAREDFIEKIKD